MNGSLKKISLSLLLAGAAWGGLMAICDETKSQRQARERNERAQRREEQKRRQEPWVRLGERPLAVQVAVDRAFVEISCYSAEKWRYSGDEQCDYSLLALDFKTWLPNLVSNAEEDDIYILDVGCAQSGWGRGIMRTLLEYEEAHPTGKQIHIFSVTGGLECENAVERKGNVEHRSINQLKIENIDDELLPRGFDGKGKFNLIVSAWTLEHLVDPFGTLKRMYSLLIPGQGMLAAKGFVFVLDNKLAQIGVCEETGARDGFDILAATNAVSLFRGNRDGMGEFLLTRTDDQELAIPLEYTGEVYQGDRVLGDKAFFKRVPSEGEVKGIFYFKRVCCISGLLVQEEEDGVYHDNYQRYCAGDSQLSKDLHAELKRQGLFCR